MLNLVSIKYPPATLCNSRQQTMHEFEHDARLQNQQLTTSEAARSFIMRPTWHHRMGKLGNMMKISEDEAVGWDVNIPGRNGINELWG